MNPQDNDIRCRIKAGWLEAGREGHLLCFVTHPRVGQTWAVVMWDDEEDPDCFKAAGLEIKTEKDETWQQA